MFEGSTVMPKTFEEWNDAQPDRDFADGFDAKWSENRARDSWQACAAEYSSQIADLEAQLAASREMGPCGKHPRSRWQTKIIESGEYIRDGGWCTICEEIKTVRESYRAELAALESRIDAGMALADQFEREPIIFDVCTRLRAALDPKGAKDRT
jgi:hypothetical protein